MNTLPVKPNSRENWDAIWTAEGEDTWRTYPKLYDRIIQLVDEGTNVFDIGCGVGKLLDRLGKEKGCLTYGLDISPVAVAQAYAKAHIVTVHNLDDGDFIVPSNIHYVVATEMLEHLDNIALDKLLSKVSAIGCRAIFAVPNNCMGPDEESQHHQKWTALAFKKLLRKYFKTVRIECIDDGAPRLLAVCNYPAKTYQLAFTMPVKNEAHDIERVIKSFYGAADFIVIGVDDKSTDETEVIIRRYTDDVFFFTWENDFSKARNACIEYCRTCLSSPDDWIFMSEGHEHLEAGLDELLNFDQMLSSTQAIEVRREDQDNAWMFPWVFRNRPSIHFENPAHNALIYDDKYSVQVPAIRTWHTAHPDNRKERSFQRRYMNRHILLQNLSDDPRDSRSCYYLANEWRGENNDKAIEYYCRYLAMNGKNGPERYQARLALSTCLIQRVSNRAKLPEDTSTAIFQHQDMQLVYDTLIVASADDWSRNEHWLYLGDICSSQLTRVDQAMRFYELAAVSIGREPLSFMWIEKANYSWIPAQKLVTIYARLGMLAEALPWCEKVAQLLPPWAPQEARDEVERHRQTIIEKMEVGK